MRRLKLKLSDWSNQYSDTSINASLGVNVIARHRV